VVLVVVLRLTGHRPWPVWPGFASDLGAALHQWWPAIIAATIHAGTAVVDQVMAAHLIAGSVAAFGYGQRLVMMPLYVVMGIIAPAFLAVLSRTQRSAPTADVIRIANWWRRRLWWSAAAGSAVVMLAAPWLTKLLFERGHFTASDTAEVALVIAALATMAPWFLVGSLTTCLFNVQRGNQHLPRIAVVNLIVSIGMNLWLAPRLGILGVAVANTVVYLVLFLQVEWLIRRVPPKALDHGQETGSGKQA
jgi:putative peptidoglycan lipid II flippase